MSAISVIMITWRDIMIKCNLAVLMAERKMSIQDVADKTGLSRTTISALVNENGKGIQFETMDILCRLFNITPGDLFTYFHFETLFSFIIKRNQKRDPIVSSEISLKNVKDIIGIMAANLRTPDIENVQSELVLEVDVQAQIESDMSLFKGNINMDLEVQLNKKNEVCGFSYIAASEEFSKFMRGLSYSQSGFIIASFFVETANFFNEIPGVNGIDNNSSIAEKIREFSRPRK